MRAGPTVAVFSFSTLNVGIRSCIKVRKMRVKENRTDRTNRHWWICRQYFIPRCHGRREVIARTETTFFQNSKFFNIPTNNHIGLKKHTCRILHVLFVSKSTSLIFPQPESMLRIICVKLSKSMTDATSQWQRQVDRLSSVVLHYVWMNGVTCFTAWEERYASHHVLHSVVFSFMHWLL